MDLSIDQQRVSKVLQRLLIETHEDKHLAEKLVSGLETMLNQIHDDDGFGTEGQSDPRGDFRDGDWSMTKVQGVDYE